MECCASLAHRYARGPPRGGAGFIGSITVAGPDASELAVRELGLQAYGFAARSLS